MTARVETLRLVDFARRGVELYAVLMAETPTTGLTAEEVRDLREARDLLCEAGAALRRLIGRGMPSSAAKDGPGGPGTGDLEGGKGKLSCRLD
jgi:hypothetical protein